MSTTWSTLLSILRYELGDTGNTTRWPDEVLYSWTCDAVRDYSLTLPLRKVEDLVEDSGGLFYDLPIDFLGAMFVEVPEGTTLSHRIMSPGHRYLSRQGLPTQFWIDGEELYLNGEAPDDFTPILHYNAVHTVPANHTDTFTFSVKDTDMELIRLYVKARAMQQIRSSTSMLDRFKVGSGPRDDNPLRPEVDNLMEEYEEKLARRVPGGIIRTYRPGNR